MQKLKNQRRSRIILTMFKNTRTPNWSSIRLPSWEYVRCTDVGVSDIVVTIHKICFSLKFQTKTWFKRVTQITIRVRWSEHFTHIWIRISVNGLSTRWKRQISTFLSIWTANKKMRMKWNVSRMCMILWTSRRLFLSSFLRTILNRNSVV